MKRLLALLLAVAAAGCGQDAAIVREYGGLLATIQYEPLGDRRFRIFVETSSIYLSGQAEQFFRDTARNLCKDNGGDKFAVEALETEIENAITGTKRRARGIVRCVATG